MCAAFPISSYGICKGHVFNSAHSIRLTILSASPKTLSEIASLPYVHFEEFSDR
jgi:hypothetical protein